MNRQIVSFSGGKDSTAMLLAMIEKREPIEAVLFCDLGKEFQALYTHIEKVKAYVESKGIRFVTVKADFDFYFSEYTLKKGAKAGVSQGYSWPRGNFRWCTRIKLESMSRWQKANGLQDAVVCVGLASDETARLERKATSLGTKRYPLVEYGMTEADCLKFCFERGYDFGGLYQHFSRLGCFCCPFKRIGELRKIYLHYPNEWKQIRLLRERERDALGLTTRLMS